MRNKSGTYESSNAAYSFLNRPEKFRVRTVNATWRSFCSPCIEARDDKTSQGAFLFFGGWVGGIIIGTQDPKTDFAVYNFNSSPTSVFIKVRGKS